MQKYHHEWYLANKERLNALSRQYYESHKAELSKKSREYERKNRGRYRAWNKATRARLKLEVLQHYSEAPVPYCKHCGTTDIDVLCLDHIENDGAKHRRSIGEKVKMAVWLKKHNFPVGYQVLCANCNLKKQLRRQAS